MLFQQCAPSHTETLGSVASIHDTLTSRCSRPRSRHETPACYCRSIVLLESNAGYLQLHELLQSAGSRDKVIP